MHDFSCTQPDDMNYAALAERARYFKESQKGREIMCKAFEELVELGEKQGAKQTLIVNIKTLMKTLNFSVDQAMDALMVTADMRDELKKIIQAA